MSEPRSPWWKRKASTSDIERKDAVLTGFVIVGAVYAWAISPAQRYADPRWIFGGAFLILTGLLCNIVLPWRRGDVALTALFGPFLPIIPGALILYIAGADAVNKSTWNDRRCLIIQQALLRPTPRTRDDIADVFTAMSCRPQGGQPIDPNYRFSRYGPAPTEASTAAHIQFVEDAMVNEVGVDKSDTTTTTPASAAPVTRR